MPWGFIAFGFVFSSGIGVVNGEYGLVWIELRLIVTF